VEREPPGKNPAGQRPAGPRGGRLFAVASLVGLFVLHQDVWLWRDPRLVFGLPAGLAGHVAFCVAATAALALAVRWAWPAEVPVDGDEDGNDGRGGPA
jgi:hypothetical protein